jgi:hypothetical protein
LLGCSSSPRGRIGTCAEDEVGFCVGCRVDRESSTSSSTAASSSATVCYIVGSETSFALNAGILEVGTAVAVLPAMQEAEAKVLEYRNSFDGICMRQDNEEEREKRRRGLCELHRAGSIIRGPIEGFVGS